MRDDYELLIVEDDPIALYMIEEMSRAGLPESVIANAPDAQTAFEHCTLNKVDCVLLDMSLPGENGLSLAGRLREKYPYLPIVMCTGVGDEMTAKQAIQIGVNDYIPKSVLSPTAIARAVNNAVKLSDRTHIIDVQNSDIQAFAHVLAHDVKQPVRQIETFCLLLDESRERGDSVGVDHCLGFIQRAAGRLSRLIDVLADYSLLQRAPPSAPVDIAPLVAEVIEDLQAVIESRGGEVRIQGEGQAIGNSPLLGQVLQNLIGNGLKYNDAPVPTVTVDILPEGTNLLIRVGDNGIGIEEHHQRTIFDPLVRLQSSSDYEGTGLGLSIAQKAVELMEGSITCHSRLGEGSLFTVSLPMEPMRSVEGACQELHRNI